MCLLLDELCVWCPIPLGFLRLKKTLGQFAKEKTAPRHEKSRSMTLMPLGAAFLVAALILAGIMSNVNGWGSAVYLPLLVGRGVGVKTAVLMGMMRAMGRCAG